MWLGTAGRYTGKEGFQRGTEKNGAKHITHCGGDALASVFFLFPSMHSKGPDHPASQRWSKFTVLCQSAAREAEGLRDVSVGGWMREGQRKMESVPKQQ